MKQKNSLTAKKWLEVLNHKWFTIGALALISIVYYCSYQDVYDTKLDLNGDNVYYYSLAQCLSEGDGYVTGMGFKDAPHTHFPPGYPAFISLMMRVGFDSIEAVKNINGILMWLSLLLFFLLFRRATNNPFVAFAAVLLTTIHPELLRWATIIMSETLFIFISVLVLFMISEIHKSYYLPDKKWLKYSMIVFVAALLAYSLLVRTIGLSLVIAVFVASIIMMLHTYLKNKKGANSENVALLKKYAMLIGLVLVFSATLHLSWSARNDAVGKTSNNYMNDIMHTKDKEEMTIDTWGTRLWSNAQHYIADWIPDSLKAYQDVEMKDTVETKDFILGLFILVLMIFGCVMLTNELRWHVFFYIAITLGVLWIYPEWFGCTRYLSPLIPYFMLIVVGGMYKLCELIVKKLKWNENIGMMFAAVLIVAFYFTFQKDSYKETRDYYKKMAAVNSWTNVGIAGQVFYLRAAEWCGKNLPEGSRVYCRKPELAHIYSNGKSKNIRFSMFNRNANEEEALEQLNANNVRFIIIDSWMREAYDVYVPLAKKHPTKFRIIKEVGRMNKKKEEFPCYVVEYRE